MPFQTHKLIKSMNLLGYPKLDGICAGLSMMARNAFLLNQLSYFEKRFNAIEKITYKEFKKIARLLDEGLAFHLLPKLIQEIIIFYDSLFMYQSPEHLSPSIIQSEIAISEWFLPEALKNQLFHLDAFSGVYKKSDLVIYLNLLQDSFRAFGLVQCSLHLASGDHSIHLGYLSGRNEWSLIDSNNFPVRKYNDVASLATAIVASFMINEDAALGLEEIDPCSVFCTQITVYKSYQEALLNCFSYLGKHPDWHRIHEVTISKSLEQCSNGFNWLMLASYIGEYAIVRRLLRSPLIDVNEKSFNGSTPLKIAIKEKQARIVESLLQCPQIDLFDDFNDSFHPFIHACASTSEIVSLFLRHPKINQIINKPEPKKNRPIHVAIRENRPDILNMLVVEKGDILEVNCPDGFGLYPLHIICYQNSLELLEVLCRAPRINLECKQNNKTPFMVAVNFGHFKLAAYLHQNYGVNINACNSYGETVLVSSIKNFQMDAVKFLFGLPGLNVDYPDLKNDTPFILACKAQNLDLILSCLDKGANPILRNIDNQTGLDILVRARAWDLIRQVQIKLNEKGLLKEAMASLSPLCKKDLSRGLLNPISLNMRFSFLANNDPDGQAARDERQSKRKRLG